MNMESHGGMVFTGKTKEHGGEKSVPMSSTNPTGTDLCAHSDLHNERPVNNRLSHDMAMIPELQLLACLSAVVTASRIELVTLPRHISTPCLGLLIMNLSCSTCLLSYTEIVLFKKKLFFSGKFGFCSQKAHQ
jgi:hypothetical protein